MPSNPALMGLASCRIPHWLKSFPRSTWAQTAALIFVSVFLDPDINKRCETTMMCMFTPHISFILPTPEGWPGQVDLRSLVDTKMVQTWLKPVMVTHPSTNRSRRKSTTSIDTMRYIPLYAKPPPLPSLKNCKGPFTPSSSTSVYTRVHGRRARLCRYGTHAKSLRVLTKRISVRRRA